MNSSVNWCFHEQIEWIFLNFFILTFMPEFWMNYSNYNRSIKWKTCLRLSLFTYWHIRAYTTGIRLLFLFSPSNFLFSLTSFYVFFSVLFFTIILLYKLSAMWSYTSILRPPLQKKIVLEKSQKLYVRCNSAALITPIQEPLHFLCYQF